MVTVNPIDGLSNSEIVRGKIRLFDQQLGLAAYNFWRHTEFPRLYREYIFQSHSIIRASVPLMEAAEQACGLPQHADDPALQGFAQYLHHHIPQETGHADWILDDGEAMGLERADILARLPTETATQLVGVQYYWIHHYNPIAMVGHIAPMEGDPPPTELVERTAHKHGMSLDCFSNFLYHARIDPQHRKDLDDVLDSLPLTQDHLALIGLSTIRTIGMITRIMNGIIQTVDAN